MYFKYNYSIVSEVIVQVPFWNGSIQISLRTQTFFRSSLLSTRKVTSANPSSKMISVTLGLLFLCRPIRSKDRIQLEWILATSLAGVSWILVRLTKYALSNMNFTTITRFPATLNATITTGWQQHATASWEATTGNTSVSAGYHTRIRCNAKKNNKKINGQTMRYS